MINPLEIAPPADPVERIHALARDLVWGAVHNVWWPVIPLTNEGAFWIGSENADGERLKQYLISKWALDYPSTSFLLSFGYLEHKENTYYGADYLLTEKAFELLGRPVSSRVFISYSRQESSAFALLILARLKAVGLDVFLDITGLTPGQDWREQLRNEISTREHFICLIAPGTLQSSYVHEEIAWASQAGIRTIPIWHNGFRFQPNDHPELNEFLNKNAIIVENENAKAYNNAIVELLNYFGYTPG